MTFLGKIRFMPPQLCEIGFHVQNHATQWHGFQHEIQFQEVVVIQAWKPSITMRQILIGIQDLLDNPNPASPAQDLAYDLFTEVSTQLRLILLVFN